MKDWPAEQSPTRARRFAERTSSSSEPRRSRSTRGWRRWSSRPTTAHPRSLATRRFGTPVSSWRTGRARLRPPSRLSVIARSRWGSSRSSPALRTWLEFRACQHTGRPSLPCSAFGFAVRKRPRAWSPPSLPGLNFRTFRPTRSTTTRSAAAAVQAERGGATSKLSSRRTLSTSLWRPKRTLAVASCRYLWHLSPAPHPFPAPFTYPS